MGSYTLLQGMIGIILVDKMRNRNLVVLLKRTCKIAIIFYVLMSLVRTLIYFTVHKVIRKVDKDHTENKGIGSFLAEYVDDATGSILLTIILILLFGGFYLSNFWMIYLMNKQFDFMKSHQDEQLIAETIMVGPNTNNNFGLQNSFVQGSSFSANKKSLSGSNAWANIQNVNG